MCGVVSAHPESAATPLRQAVRRLREGPADAVAPAVAVGPPDGPGWLERDALIAPEALEGLMATVARTARSDDPRVTGTLLLEGYAWALAAPAIALHLAERRVPDVRAAVVRVGPHGYADGLAYRSARFAALPGDPDARHGHALVVADEGAQLAWLRRGLVDHLEPVVAALAVRSRRGPRALWASVEDCCSAALTRLGDLLGAGDAARAQADLLLGVEPPLRGRARYRLVDGTVVHERVGCCQSFRRPAGAVCPGCPRARGAREARPL